MELKLEVTKSLKYSEHIDKQIDEILQDDGGEKYNSKSHFIRCAMMRLIREELGR